MTTFDLIKAFLKGLDLKTVLIILLIIMVCAFMLFNRKGPGSNTVELDILKKQHKQELKEIEEANEELEAKIVEYLNIIEQKDQSIAKRDREIRDIQSKLDARRKKIQELQKELQSYDKQFKNMNEDELLDWVKQYLEQRGIKE